MAFNNWLEVFKEIHEELPAKISAECPECGGEVDFEYVASPDTKIGYLPIWCKECNKGIHISRVEVPVGTSFIDMSNKVEIESRIPDFKWLRP